MTSFLPRLVGVGSVKFIRSFHRTCVRTGTATYEGEGKTTVTILNRNGQDNIMIDTISSAGFQLTSGIWILGPTIIFPKSILSWQIGSSNDISEDSLALFKVLEPPLDLLIVGLDQKYDYSEPFLKTLKHFAKSISTNIEILSTEHACSTFNYLNFEKRYVAAALMPIKQQLPKKLGNLRNSRNRYRLAEPEVNESPK